MRYTFGLFKTLADKVCFCCDAEIKIISCNVANGGVVAEIARATGVKVTSATGYCRPEDEDLDPGKDDQTNDPSVYPDLRSKGPPMDHTDAWKTVNAPAGNYPSVGPCPLPPIPWNPN